MRIHSLLVAAIFLSPVAIWAQKQTSSIAGVWKGESTCAVHDSPCKNAQVLFEITHAATTSTPSHANAPPDWMMNQYVMADGKKQFVHTLRCSYEESKRSLSCKPTNDIDWEFFFDGETSKGTMTLGKQKALYLTISAKRILRS